jgi:lipoprotein LprG
VKRLTARSSYHLQGSISGERLQGMSGGLIGTGPIDVDLWIEPDTYLPRQAVIVDKDSDPEKPSTWTLTFSSYGKDQHQRPSAIVRCDVVRWFDIFHY